jgi:hypothetical protein
MDLKQTAVNTLSYQLDRAPKLTPPARRHKGLEPWVCGCHAAPGPPADHRSGVSGHLVQAGRQLRRAARPLRPASAVAGQ